MLSTRPLFLFFIIYNLLPIGNARKPPAKVFLIAGDDNVEGFGYLSQLEERLDNPKFQNTPEAEKYAHLRDGETHAWTERKDVFVVYERERHKQLQGTLNMVDYGGMVNQTFG